jgi:hypothetical protein
VKSTKFVWKMKFVTVPGDIRDEVVQKLVRMVTGD